MTGETPAVEKAERSVFKGASQYEKRVVVSSVQTLMQDARREPFGRDQFGLVVVDEAHHWVSPGFEKVLRHFSGAKIVGMTATVDRTDEVSLGKIFDRAPYYYDVSDAVRDGWLCPIKQQYVVVDELDWSRVRLDSGGDLSAEDLDRVIGEEETLHKIVAPIVQMAGDRQTIVFCPRVRTAEEVAKLIPRYTDGGAVAVSGKTPKDERHRAVDQFRYGEIQFVSNAMVFTEGFDAPSTACIAVCRPTRSRLLYSQMVGRGLRGGHRWSVPGKSDCLVIDLVGASLQHKLVTGVDLLGGRYDEVVVEAARDYCREKAESDAPADVLEELRRAYAVADELRREQRLKVIAEAKVKRKTVDPFDVIGAGLLPEVPAWWADDRPATEEQTEWLKDRGVQTEGAMTQRQAEQMREILKGRQRDGLCSYKMARRLKPFGFDPFMTYSQGRAVMKWLSTRAGGWAMQNSDHGRRAHGLKIGRMKRYAECDWLPQWFVGKNVACRIRKNGTDEWRPWTTRFEQWFDRAAHADGQSVVFATGGWQLAVDRELAEDLKA
jgi:superfamily II DNA or RNA helicase